MLEDDFFSIEAFELIDSTGQGRVQLNPLNAIFKGHFPGEPVVPGVTMIRMSEELVSKGLNQTWRIKESKSIKFLSVIDPNLDTILNFDFQIKPEDGQLKMDFTLFKMDGTLSFKMSCLLKQET